MVEKKIGLSKEDLETLSKLWDKGLNVSGVVKEDGTTLIIATDRSLSPKELDTPKEVKP